MTQNTYTYLEMEAKRGSGIVEATVTLSGYKRFVAGVQEDLGKLPLGVAITKNVMASAMEIIITSQRQDVDVHLLKMAVLSAGSLSQFQIVPNSMFADLTNGAEKLMLYTAGPAGE